VNWTRPLKAEVSPVRDPTESSCSRLVRTALGRENVHMTSSPLAQYLTQASISPDEVFFVEERPLREAAKRHLKTAEVLLAHGGLELIAEADYHALMAAECFFKHMFCIVRLIRGWPVSEKDETFGKTVAARRFNHDIWSLGPIVRMGHPDLLTNETLNAVVSEMERGSAWVERRYAAKDVNEGWKAKVQSRVEQLQILFGDLLG
jgi:hypothetical protein